MDRPDITPFVDVLEAWLRDNAEQVEQLLGSDWCVRLAVTWDGIPVEIAVQPRRVDSIDRAIELDAAVRDVRGDR